MSEIIAVVLDEAKNVFQVDGADGSGKAVLRKKLRRAQVLEFSVNRRAVWLERKRAVAPISGVVRLSSLALR